MIVFVIEISVNGRAPAYFHVNNRGAPAIGDKYVIYLLLDPFLFGCDLCRVLRSTFASLQFME